MRIPVRGWHDNNTHFVLGVTVLTAAVALSLAVNAALERPTLLRIAKAEARATARTVRMIGQDHGFASMCGFPTRIISPGSLAATGNADEWERKALRQVLARPAEVAEQVGAAGQGTLRFMQPLSGGPACRQCHGARFKPGVIEGGISVKVPLAPLIEAARAYRWATRAGHLLIWIAGLVFVARASSALGRRARLCAASEANLRDLYDNAPIGYHEIDREGRIVSVNRAEAALLGFEPAELIGRHVWEMVAEAGREESREAILSKLGGGPLVPVRRRLVCRDGAERTVEVWDRAVRSPAGDITGLRSAVLDVTERDELERAKRQSDEVLRGLCVSAPDAIVMVDAAGRAVLWNPAAERMFGYSAAEILGCPIHELIAPERNRPAFHAAFPAFQATGSGTWVNQVSELRAVRKDGSEFPVELSLTGLRRDAGWYALAIIRDISERKLAAERIAASLGDLQEARARAEAATKAKSEFLSSMSHEIRTPMNGIVGMADLILDTPLSREQKSYVETIRRSCEALLAIINDILDYSRIEAGRLEIEKIPFDLRSALDDVVELLAGKAHEKGLEMTVWYPAEAPGEFLGDPGRIRQILLNLASNAVKFTHAGYVLIEADCRRLAGNMALVTLAVHDTGNGIPKERQALLFGKFQQLDVSTTRKYGGSGLGLSITRQLTELMGGSIQVASQVGEGSSFTCSVPLEVVSRDGETGRQAFHGLRALIADHHQVVRIAAVELCSRIGVRADEAESEEAALLAVAAARRAGMPYGLVCLGHNMPVLDGPATLRRLRKIPDGERIPVVMMASTPEFQQVKALAEGENVTCVVKPLNEKVLVGILQRAQAGLGDAGVPQRSDPALALPAVRFDGRRILLAEDNLVNQKVATSMLSKLGCRVDVAGNGVEAVEFAERVDYDLILMDCQMPEMDGFEAVQKIRSRRGGDSRKIPVVALTAAATESDREKCLSAGMDAFLTKPVRAEELRAVLDHHLAERASLIAMADRVGGAGAPS